MYYVLRICLMCLICMMCVVCGVWCAVCVFVCVYSIMSMILNFLFRLHWWHTLFLLLGICTCAIFNIQNKICAFFLIFPINVNTLEMIKQWKFFTCLIVFAVAHRHTHTTFIAITKNIYSWKFLSLKKSILNMFWAILLFISELSHQRIIIFF